MQPTMSPSVMNTSGGSNDFGNGALTAAALAGSNKGTVAYYPNEAALIAADNVCALRADVRDTGSEVKDSVQLLSNLMQMSFLNLHNRLCEAEKAAIDAKYQGIIETKNAVATLSEKVDHCCEETTEKLTAFEKSVDDQFCASERRELERENDALRTQIVNGQQSAQTTAIITAVLNSLGVTIKPAVNVGTGGDQ